MTSDSDSDEEVLFSDVKRRSSKYRDFDQRESRRTALVSLLTLCLGLALVGVTCAGLTSEAIQAVDRLAVFNAVWPTWQDQGKWQEVLAQDVPSLTTRRVFKALLAVGLAVALTGIVGIAGSLTRHKIVVCSSVLGSTLLAVLSFFATAEVVQRSTLAAPMVHRQVLDLCNSTHYIKLGTALECSWTSPYASVKVPECGPVCLFRKEILTHLGGCSLLPRLCTRFSYDQRANCNQEDLEKLETYESAFFSLEGSVSCQEACDSDALCDSFILNEESGTCIQSGVQTLHKAPTWEALSIASHQKLVADVAKNSSDSSVLTCHTRTRPEVLDSFDGRNKQLVTITIVLSCLLLVSSIFNWALLYNMNMNRQGRPTAAQLLMMLICPHCPCSRRMDDRFHGRAAVEAQRQDPDQDSMESVE